MQIQQVTREELGLLIMGLEAIYVSDLERTHTKLLEQLRHELSSRFGMKLEGRSTG